ncbi:MAG: sugar transferase [Chloroflexota bacterium]
MFKRFSINYLVILFLIDNALIQISFWYATHLRYWIPLGQPVQPEWANLYFYEPDFPLFLAIGLLWSAIFLLFSCYTPRRIIFWFDEFQRIWLAHTVAALSLAGILYLANILLLRLIFAYFYLILLVALISYRVLLRIWHRVSANGSQNFARILIIGAGDIGQNLVQEFERQQWPGIDIVGFLDDHPKLSHVNQLVTPILGGLDKAAEIVKDHKIDEVLIALPRDAHVQVANLTAQLHELPVRLRVVPDYFDLAFHGATIENLGNIPLIGLRDPAIDGFQRFLKRLMDIFVSFIALIGLSPLFGLIALTIKLEDGGTVFYRAPRVGENGQLFHMIKFRSMIVGADKIQASVNEVDSATGTVLHKSKSDPRVTRIGRILRRTSIDELPQLWNVLMGDMSLVGPRPELPWLVDSYEPWQRKRFAVPQGITGWWQINGRSDNMMHLHTDQDLYYIQNYSLWLDFQILWKTVSVVLRGRGAY